MSPRWRDAYDAEDQVREEELTHGRVAPVQREVWFKGRYAEVVAPQNADGWLMLRDEQGHVQEVHRDELG